MYQVIARKYRPRNFSELIGQQHVRTTLENALSRGRVAHGYIFSGQRGTGKTTVARIVARCLNCEKGPAIEPCGECSSCTEIAAGNAMDVIEIDAASNRGINEMRELRESVRFRPARDRYKIFIIDEAHQITNEAFNALLKTLEEPPGWVVFILCTTESHKIPGTIASRCQQFSFRSVDYDTVLERLEWICGQEGIAAEPEALSVITLAGEGSVRDSLSALDQAIACCGENLEAGPVRQLLGRFSFDTLERAASALSEQSAPVMLELVQELESNGQNLQHFCRELCRFFRNLLVTKIAGESSRLIAAAAGERERMAQLAGQFSEEELTRYLHLTLELFHQMQFSLHPRMHLELGLVKLVHAGRLRSLEEILGALEPGGGAASPAPVSKPSPPRSGPVPAASGDAAAGSPVSAGDWKRRLVQTLSEKGLTFITDAVEHSEVNDRGGELEFVTSREFAMAIRSRELQKAADTLARRPVKIVVRAGEAALAAPMAGPEASHGEEEATRRALENPEVQRFRELFPGSEVRAVRNLKESQ